MRFGCIFFQRQDGCTRQAGIAQHALVERLGFGHGSDPHFLAQAALEGRVLLDGPRPVAALVARGDQLPQSVFMKGIAPQELLGETNCRRVVTVGAALEDEPSQAGEIQLTQALALEEHPIVVDGFEQIAGIARYGLFQLFGPGAQAFELGHIQPAAGLRVPANRVRIAGQPGAVGRRRRQGVLQPVQVAAQVGARRRFSLIGPQCKGYLLAFEHLLAVKQQVGEQWQRLWRGGEGQRLPTPDEARLAEKIDLQHV